MDTMKEVNTLYNSKVAPYVSNNKIWLAIFGGAVAAIAIAALIYPEKSKELLNKATDSATDLAERIGDTASTYATKIKDAASDYAENLKNQVDTEKVASIAKKAMKKKEAML